eukprot:COSAG02_NODE_3419_length_6778_cov_2.101362_4_plen_66_part_00
MKQYRVRSSHSRSLAKPTGCKRISYHAHVELCTLECVRSALYAGRCHAFILSSPLRASEIKTYMF